jgi:metal-responsive CopG/Arc/MetJ family transcriptional regulator
MDEELMKKADDMAKKHFIPTRSSFIHHAIRHYMRYLKKRNGN